MKDEKISRQKEGTRTLVRKNLCKTLGNAKHGVYDGGKRTPRDEALRCTRAKLHRAPDPTFLSLNIFLKATESHWRGLSVEWTRLDSN